jgi:Arc/MetJ-type ribon-helix-helix transcriptional regulator
MGAITIRLPEKLEEALKAEVRQAGQSQSEIMRLALAGFLSQKRKQERLAAYIRAAESLDPASSLAMAEEALALDNEALLLAEPKAAYGQGRGKAKRKPR